MDQYSTRAVLLGFVRSYYQSVAVFVRRSYTNYAPRETKLQKPSKYRWFWKSHKVVRNGYKFRKQFVCNLIFRSFQRSLFWLRFAGFLPRKFVKLHESVKTNLFHAILNVFSVHFLKNVLPSNYLKKLTKQKVMHAALVCIILQRCWKPFLCRSFAHQKLSAKTNSSSYTIRA